MIESNEAVRRERRWGVVATGGTFDRFHKGHRSLLTEAFNAGEFVYIGVVSDQFARQLRPPERRPQQDFATRSNSVRRFVETNFPGRRYAINLLNDYFGPAVYDGNVEALVATEETAQRIELANRVRRERGFPPLELVVVPWTLAEDGKPISATRIRLGEIDEEGRLRK